MEVKGKEFWQSLGWSERIVMVAAVVIVIATAAILSPEFRVFISDGATAAWVQAIGSIGAIVGAFVLIDRAAKSNLNIARILARDDEFKKMTAILAICKAAALRANEVDGLFDKAGDSEHLDALLYVGYDESIITSFVSALSAIPVHEIGSAEAAVALLDLRDQLIFLRSYIERYKDGSWSGGLASILTPEERAGTARRAVKGFVKRINQHYEDIEAAIALNPTSGEASPL